MEGSPPYLIGIDWASDKHDVCVLDPCGAIKASFVVSHTAEGLAETSPVARRYVRPRFSPLASISPCRMPGQARSTISKRSTRAAVTKVCTSSSASRPERALFAITRV